MEYCKEQGSQVLLVKFPRIDWTAEQAEAEQAFADELGVPLLDLNEQACWEATDLDPELDFYDFNHVSTTGATKLSHYLGAYLQENYGLTDKRADPAYASWNENVPEYEEEFAFCLHMVTGEDGLTFRMEASQAFLERNQIAPEDLTYSWTLYRIISCFKLWRIPHPAPSNRSWKVLAPILLPVLSTATMLQLRYTSMESLPVH